MNVMHTVRGGQCGCGWVGIVGLRVGLRVRGELREEYKGGHGGCYWREAVGCHLMLLLVLVWVVVWRHGHGVVYRGH